MKRQLTTFTFCVSIVSAVLSQNIDQEDITYKYQRLPLKPLSKDIKGYVSKVEQSYDAKNQELKAEYKEAQAKADEKYKQDMTRYEEQSKQADADYKKAMDDYNNKSIGKKTAEKLLLDSQKPTRAYVPKPEKEIVTLSTTGTEYNKELFATTYLKLDGYMVNGANPVKITAILNGFEIQDPEKVASDHAKVVNGVSSVVKKYKYKMKYRHPVMLKVEAPDKGTLMDETVEKTNEYTEATTQDFDSEYDLNAYWEKNKEALTKKYDEDITGANMKRAGNQLNFNFGFSIVSRETKLYTLKDKKGDYQDLTTAYTTAQLAFNTIDGGFKKEGIVEMKKSVEAWEKAMTESNLSEKKARINEKVTMAVLFNLIEGYNILEDYTSAVKCLIKLKGMDLSNRETRHLESLNTFIMDQKLRFEAAAQ